MPGGCKVGKILSSAGSLGNGGGHWGPRNKDSVIPEVDVSL